MLLLLEEKDKRLFLEKIGAALSKTKNDDDYDMIMECVSELMETHVVIKNLVRTRKEKKKDILSASSQMLVNEYILRSRDIRKKETWK